MAVIDDLKSTSVFVFIGIGITFLACIINIVALASVGWGTIPMGIDGSTDTGLFRTCTTYGLVTQCYGYDEIQLGGSSIAWLRGVAATRTIGTLLTIAGIAGIAVFVLIFHGENKNVYKAGIACLGAAVGCSIIGMAVFTAYWDAAFFGAMYSLAWAGTVILLAGAVILGVAYKYFAPLA